MNATPVPKTAMISPPIRGPINVYVTGRTNCASESLRRAGPRARWSGTIEVSDGLKIA